MNFLQQPVVFLSQTLSSPRFTGAVAPSSRRLANLIVEQAALGDAKTIVELGPGTGVFTKKILQKINNKTNYLGIEINPIFIKQLRREFPEVEIFHDSAENIALCLGKKGLKKCDRVVSGLPWTAFEKKLQKSLLKAVCDVLEEGGIFVTFSYCPLNHLPNGRAFKTLLQESFSSVTTSKVVSNIPPAFVYVCKK
jgi:phosphatidylethanolamine/phosphatidyl-N-methylethanolamine N-methyltransferase